MNGNRLMSIVLGMLTVGVLALGWFLGISPKLAEATASDTEKQLVEAQNAGYEAQLVQLASDFDRKGELQAELDKLAVAIPAGNGLEDFLDMLNASAAATGVAIDTFTAGEAAPPATAEDGSVDPDAPLMIPITVAVSGPFEGVVAFGELVQTAPRLAVISAMTATRAPEKSTGTLTGALYVIPTEPLTQAAPPAEG
ncbi:MAG TPA: type 4a pilus biogenesis protein PilO [Rhodoglobus sp.]|nr:type 4a pilus biogenesis protein PilO [Rhodoglobus sp.]